MMSPSRTATFALLFGIVSILLGGAGPSGAVEIPPEETYPALGAPDDPKVPITWDWQKLSNGIEVTYCP